MRNMLIKHEGTWSFEVGEHVWLNIWDFKMPDVSLSSMQGLMKLCIN
jgi:hypothetical protein